MHISFYKLTVWENQQNISLIKIEFRLIIQELILELELALLSLAPSSLIVEIYIRALFVFGRNFCWLFVTLEPREIFFVVPPVLSFQLFGGEVLLIGALLIVEDEEQRVHIELFVESGVIEVRGNIGRIVRRGGNIAIFSHTTASCVSVGVVAARIAIAIVGLGDVIKAEFEHRLGTHGTRFAARGQCVNAGRG